MPDRDYFFRFAGAVLLGVVTLIIAGLVLIALLPVLIPITLAVVPFVLGVLFIIIILLAIWVAIYALAFLGIFVYYFFKPMKVSKRKGKYNLKRTSEAGRRQKGTTKRK
jgi:hypothetical protein